MTSELGAHSYRYLRTEDWKEKYVKRKWSGSEGVGEGSVEGRIWWKEMLHFKMRHWPLLLFISNVPVEEVSELNNRRVLRCLVRARFIN